MTKLAYQLLPTNVSHINYIEKESITLDLSVHLLTLSDPCSPLFYLSSSCLVISHAFFSSPFVQISFLIISFAAFITIETKSASVETPTMSDKPAAMLLTLPVEILHRLFNELDGAAIFLAIRDVCQSLRAAVGSYHRYALDFTSLSKPAVRRILRVIRPECVATLSLSDRERTTGQIGLFLSLVDISLFARLRSLTLSNIDTKDLCSFLKYASGCSLNSLMLHSTSYNRSKEEEQELVHHLSLIIGQPALLHLELLSDYVSYLLTKLKWPVQFKLRYLRVKSNIPEQISKIITASPDLETLVVDEGNDRYSYVYHGHRAEEWFSTLCPRLISLTLWNLSLKMGGLQSALSQTPSLRHLKIITSSSDMMDESRWENLIENKLPVLSRFEF